MLQLDAVDSIDVSTSRRRHSIRTLDLNLNLMDLQSTASHTSIVDTIERGGKSVPLFRSKKMLFYPIFWANSKHMAILHIKLPVVWS